MWPVRTALDLISPITLITHKEYSMLLHTPKKDTAVLELMQACQRQSVKTDSDVPVLPEPLAGELAAQTARSITARETLIIRQQAYKDALVQLRTFEKQVRRRLRHAFQLVRQFRDDPNFTPDLFEAFGLRVNGTYPAKLRQLPEPIQTLSDLLTANTLAAAAGFNVLTSPTAEELTQMRETLIERHDTFETAKALYQSALAEKKRQRKASKAILLRVKLALREASVGLTPLELRHVMRAYGFTYKSKRNVSDKETVAPDSGRDDDAITDQSDHPAADDTTTEAMNLAA
jgi:hypothetical protein